MPQLLKGAPVLSALKAANDGETLAVDKARAIKEAHDIHTAIRDMEQGKIPPSSWTRALQEFHGP